MNLNNDIDGIIDGLEFAAKRPLPFWCAFFGLSALVLAVFGVVNGIQPGFFIAAMMPAGWAIALLISRPRAISVVIKDDSIVFSNPDKVLGFHEIIGVTARRRVPSKPKKSFPISVHYAGGIIQIPAKLDVPSNVVYEQILENLPMEIVASTNGALREYYDKHAELFGPERVYSFVGLKQRSKEVEPIARPLRAWSLATILVAIVYVIIGFAQGPLNEKGKVLVGAGTAFLMFAGLFFVISFVRGSMATGIKKWWESCIVVSPTGLALVQGDVVGELLWNQLKKVKYKPTAMGSFRVTSDNQAYQGIQLHVDGAVIIVPDIYNLPLDAIHERILDYWQPEQDPLLPEV
jgi:hypothetical protein